MASARALRRHYASLISRKLQFAFPKSPLVQRLTKNVSFAAHNLDDVIRPLLAACPPFYVEAGANDGLNQSNTKALELFDGWSGVLIEPIPAVFAKLVRNRNPKNHFVNSALVSSSYDASFVKMIQSNLMSTAVGLRSDILDPESHARSGARFLKGGDEVSTIKVPVRTLTSILDEVGAPSRMGLLSLDVEGAELEALDGLQFDRYRFDFILVESRSFDEIAGYLGSRGYRLYSQLTGHDYLFVDQN